MRSLKASFPLATRARKRELCPKRYASKFVHSFLGTTFLQVLCHCKPKIYLPFFEVCTYPLIHNFGFEAPTCNAISVGRPPLSNLSSQAGALPLEVRIENDSDRKFSKSKFFQSFLETTFLHDSCYPVIVSRKYIFGFSKSALTPRHNFGLEASPL